MRRCTVKRFAWVVGVLSMVLAATAVADPYTFTLDSYDVSVRDSDPGLVLYANDILSQPFSFNADQGDVEKFNLFTVGTNETTVNWFEDTHRYDIGVAFTFSSPAVNGVLTGESRGVWHLFSDDRGKIEWDNPAVFNFDDEGEFTISLSDVCFGTPGEATVKATFEYTQAPAVVPVPAPMLLASIGLAMAWRRCRRYS